MKKFLLFFTILGGGVFLNLIFSVKIVQANMGNMVINEVQITGGTGKTKQDFIELYNITNTNINLKNYRLVKRTKNGNKDVLIKSWTSDIFIPSYGYYLWANSADGFADSLDADISTSQTIAKNNGIALRLGKTDEGEIIDSVGWGDYENIFVEEIAFSTNPGNNQSIERQPAGQDTNNNSTDFTIQNNPTPTNSNNQSEPETQEKENQNQEEGQSGNSTSYSSSDIVINEFYSDINEGENEWIELYNNTNSNIDLTGWTIEDNTGSIYALDGKILHVNGFLILEKGIDFNFGLNNDKDIIILKDPNGTPIDQVAYGNYDDGNTEDNINAPDKGKTAARKTDGQDTDIDKNDFEITTTPTKGTTNNTSNGGQRYIYLGGIPGSIVINEVVTDPEEESEWIELYNKTNVDIDLSNWYLEEGAEAKTILEDIIPAYSYVVIEDLKGHLNNSGDIIFLFDDYGYIIDQVTYGKWEDGNINDNAPKANDPNSLARIGNNQDTNKDDWDWQVASVITKGAANILITNDNIEETISTLQGKLIISEIFPNPVGTDESEFIELQNISDEELDLTNLIINDNSKRRYKLKTEANQIIKLAAGEFYIISRRDSKIALNNTGGDKVTIFDTDEKIIDAITYTEKAPEGKSYALVDNKWQWTDQPTGEATNIWLKENQPPVIVLDFETSEVAIGEEFFLDASDSYDPEGENLIIEWQTNNRLNHSPIWELSFDKAGAHEIKLSISDGELKSIEQIIINVLDVEQQRSTEAKLPIGSLASSLNFNLINEFIPNPKGDDKAEFIELFNFNDASINLSGYFLDDEEGGSKPYQISTGTILEPFNYLMFKREQTGLALNNNTDTVRLLDKDGNILQQINYDNVVEDASMSRALDGNWFWTNIVTPNEENQINMISPKLKNQKLNSPFNNSVALDLTNVRDLDLKTNIIVRGIVSVEPGILGSQIFYITNPPLADEDISTGIQIYSYKKKFPKLKIGDEIEVAGTLSQSRGEHRIKIKQKDDINILSQNNTIIPSKIKTNEIGEEIEGALVQVEGEIIEIRGSSIFVDDGNGEIKIYLKKLTGINKGQLREGDMINVAGIISETSSGYRLLPRYQNDIQSIKVLGAKIDMPTEEQTDDEIIMEPRNNDEWFKYITTTLGALVIVLLIINVKIYKKKD